MRIRLTPFLLLGCSLVTACGSDDTTESTADSAVGDSATFDSPALDSPAADSPRSDTSPSGDAPGDSAPVDGPSPDVALDSGSDAPAGTCGSVSCTASDLCTRTHTTGGVCLSCSEDPAVCGTDSHCEGSCCVPDEITYDYKCQPVPGACEGTPSCSGTCGAALCGTTDDCEDVADGVVTCVVHAP